METLKLAGVTLQGVAHGGRQTSIYCPEINAVFDAGAILEGVRADNYFITHGHPDHIMALPYFVGRRSVDGSASKKIMKIHVPELLRDPVQKMVDTLGIIFGDRGPDDFIKVIGVSPGDIIHLNRGFDIQVLPTFHRGPSVGYVVLRTTQHLKPEFVGVSGSELGALRKEGVVISDEMTIPLLAIPGDTKIDFLLENKLARQAKILVHEVTVWDESFNSVAGCREYGHTHVMEIIEHGHKFEGNALVLCHRSMRWSRKEIEEIAQKRFPQSLLSKIHFFDGGD